MSATYNLSRHTIIVESTKRIPVYLSRPTVPDKKPGLILLHEWWGLNQHIKDIADRFASLGYVIAAPSLYAGTVANDVEEARKLSASITKQLSAQMIQAVFDYMEMSEFVNHRRIGIVGYCFGGTHAFNYACESTDRISAAAIFYASKLQDETRLAKITAPSIIIYGDNDQTVNIEQVRELEATLKKLKKNAQVIIYPDAPHAFCNDTNPQRYRPEAAKDAWEKTVAFFEANLNSPPKRKT
ncbi:MAG: dienelactone hydrolase family protein [Nitrososphaerales archaeon]